MSTATSQHADGAALGRSGGDLTMLRFVARAAIGPFDKIRAGRSPRSTPPSPPE
jgi:hypothetical protein